MRTTGHLKLKAEPIVESPSGGDVAQFRHLFSTLPYVNRVLETDVTREEIMDSGRHPSVVQARELCAFLMHYMGGMSYPYIAHQMGRKSHGACHEMVHRVLVCWVKSMSGKELQQLMQRRAMER